MTDAFYRYCERFGLDPVAKAGEIGLGELCSFLEWERDNPGLSFLLQMLMAAFGVKYNPAEYEVSENPDYWIKLIERHKEGNECRSQPKS